MAREAGRLTGRATLDELPHRAPIVYYGGRLAQGYGASRPGRAAGAVLGREIDREVINLGLGEGGQLDLAAGALLAEINAESVPKPLEISVVMSACFTRSCTNWFPRTRV